MFDDIPAQAWILLFIAALAWTPAQYVFRHLRHSPSRRDITQPAQDLSWRSSGALTKSVAMLIILAALAVFIFTPAAAKFAQSPSFLPLLLAGLGGVTLWSVVKGYTSGIVEPMVRGASWEFSRAGQPKRYWASMGWNGLLGGALLVFGGTLFVEAPTQALRDSCYGWDKAESTKEALAACNSLLTEHPDEDRADVLAARGSAYFMLGDYHRASADYAGAIRLDPDNSTYHYNLGLAHDRLGMRERAIENYAAAIHLDPKNVEAFENRGLIFLHSGRFDEAIADFTNAHDLQLANIASLANRGIAYAWKDDRTRAEQDFAAMRKTDPSNQALLHGEAVLAMNRDDMAGAVRLLSNAIAQNPRDARAFAMRAEAYRRLGEPDKMQADVEATEELKRTKARRDDE